MNPERVTEASSAPAIAQTFFYRPDIFEKLTWFAPSCIIWALLIAYCSIVPWWEVPDGLRIMAPITTIGFGCILAAIAIFVTLCAVPRLLTRKTELDPSSRECSVAIGCAYQVTIGFDEIEEVLVVPHTSGPIVCLKLRNRSLWLAIYRFPARAIWSRLGFPNLKSSPGEEVLLANAFAERLSVAVGRKPIKGVRKGSGLIDE